ncbi:MAG TPA: glycosyltransferase [Candidatus Paceibacterota bacterium]|nr:glycosyltransferase [Candidatus Paceibacterota bacterium]
MISIIIPTFREEKDIADSIKAIKNGLTIPHEIIVSDGGSDDRTVEIAKQYTNKVIVGKSGVSRQRNAGAREARGEFLVFIDCGSAIGNPDTFFKRALNDFNDPGVVGVSAAQRVFPESETYADWIIYGFFSYGYRLLNNVLHIGTASGKLQMVRRSAYDATTGFREDLIAGEDTEFFHRLSKIGRTDFDPHLVVYHANRRARQIGWPRLLLSWTLNTMWLILFNKSFSKEWKHIR